MWPDKLKLDDVVVPAAASSRSYVHGKRHSFVWLQDMQRHMCVHCRRAYTSVTRHHRRQTCRPNPSLAKLVFELAPSKNSHGHRLHVAWCESCSGSVERSVFVFCATCGHYAFQRAKCLLECCPGAKGGQSWMVRHFMVGRHPKLKGLRIGKVQPPRAQQPWGNTSKSSETRQPPPPICVR